jgi:hypothetical protein
MVAGKRQCLRCRDLCQKSRRRASRLPEEEDARREFAPTHPGASRSSIPSRAMVDHLIVALLHRGGYERIPSTGCSIHIFAPPPARTS